MRGGVLGSLARVLDLRVVALFLTRVFAKVEAESLRGIVLVSDFCAGVLVVCGVFGRLHKGTFRGAERHSWHLVDDVSWWFWRLDWDK